MQVLYYAQSNSSNSRFLLFKIISDSYSQSTTELNEYKLIQEIWCLVRIVFIEECLNSEKSNIIRNNILKIIKDQQENASWNLQTYFHDRQKSEYSISKNTLNEVLQSKNNEESKFVIYLYCYLNEFETLSSRNPGQYKFNQLEHFFPTSWQRNWSNKNFTKEEIYSYIKDEIDMQDFPNINKDNILDEVKLKENLELVDAVNHKQKESLLQFIGNKWVMHASTNIIASNKEFAEKKTIYQDTNILKLPKNDNEKIGLNQYEDFTYKEIITRSLRIIDGIFGKFYNTWEDI